MSKVEIYTKGYCPYCHHAKELLGQKGQDYIEYPIDKQPELRDEMIKRARGGSTVPQIFIDNKHVGGCDDLHAMDYNGTLDSLLGVV